MPSVLNVKPAGAVALRLKVNAALSISDAVTAPEMTAAPSAALAALAFATGASFTAVTVTLAVATEVAPEASVTLYEKLSVPL